MEIKNKILKVEPVEWRTLKFLQGPTLKQFPPEYESRLRESMLVNHFVMSFKVWENRGQIYCIDGYHRILILKQLEERGYSVPDRLPAEFVDCRDRREAAKLVLIYSSHYTEISKPDLNDFILEHGLSVDRLSDEINILFTGRAGGGADEGEEVSQGGPEYPIEAIFSEAYDYLVIFCKNSIDFANLSQVLKIATKRSRKNSAIGVSRVLSYDEFMQLWRSR